MHAVQNKFIHTGFWWGYIKEKGHSKDLDNNIKTDHKEIGWYGVDWIHLPQDSDMWWVHTDTVGNLLYHNIQGMS